MTNSPASQSKAVWVNAVLIPVKQHVVCCGLLPLAASLAGGSVEAALETPAAEMAMFALVPPIVTYGVMWAEQKWHDRQDKKKHACECNKTLTLKNFFKQTALSYAFYAAAHLLFAHDHKHEHGDHDSKDHDHSVHMSQEKIRHIAGVSSSVPFYQ